MNIKKSTEDFIKKAIIVHGYKYDYSKVEYINNKTKVTIICPIHGDFMQKAERHLEGQGCSKCALLGRHKAIQSVAINDTEVNTKKERSYRVWHNLLDRTLNEKVKKQTPTYSDVSICDEWLVYSNFKQWFDNPVNGYIEGYELDKDILIKGNKVYSPDTCCFVPHEINSLLINRRRFRGKYPVGVSRNNSGTYKATLAVRGARIIIGTFDTEVDAFNAYKRAKEAILKSIAEEYYKDNLITKKVYDALLSYKIEITD